MPRFAEYFAQIDEHGKVTAITSATPAHELTENQVMLTSREYALLRVVMSLEEARKLLDSIQYKISRQMEGKLP